MNRSFLFLSALLPYLFLLGSTSCSPKQGVEEVGRDITLQDLFYGMTGDDPEDRSYQGTCCILDSLPGVIRYEDFGTWRFQYDPYQYEASLCVYVDEEFPSEAIASSLAVHADTTINYYFIPWIREDNFVAPHPDYGKMRESRDFVEFFKDCFAKSDSVMGVKTEEERSYEWSLPFRVALVLCRIYSLDGFATYILETSVDANGSCGCPSDAVYATYDMDGKIIGYGDIFKDGSESRVNVLLNDRFDEEYEKKNGVKPEPHEPYDLFNDKCALVKEGVIFYYPPYTLGSGAEGQYNLILEYGEIEDILKESISHGAE